MSIESSEWEPGTGLLWVSHDTRLTGSYTNLTWYGYDILNKVIVDSFTLISSIPGGLDEYPRGIAFSPDGGAVYVGLFGIEYDRIYRFLKYVPVELTSFSFSVKGMDVQLQWTTATELNNHGFEIERSYNSKDFFTAGFVKGNGTTTETKSYNFTDSPPINSVYYRLKQVDFNGSYEYSNVIYVDLNQVNGFSLSQNFPNPFNPVTVISYQLPQSGMITLKVYDILGREVASLVDEYQPEGRYEVEFDAEGLSSGVYLYRIKAGSFMETRKMILLR
jgi:hypothetical protein